MNVLIVVNDTEHLSASISYAERLFGNAHRVFLLGIISASKEIPTTSNGRVLEDCTEFDLSPYELERTSFLKAIEELPNTEIQFDSAIWIGDREQILLTETKEFNPDLLIMASELTTPFSDLFMATHADQVLEESPIPLLSFKCEKVWAPLNEIGILVNPAHVSARDLQLIEDIQKRSAAQTSLFVLDNEKCDSSSINAVRDIAKRLNIERPHWHFLGKGNPEDAMRSMIEKHPIQLLVVFELTNTGDNEGFFPNLESDITNHLRIPILTY